VCSSDLTGFLGDVLSYSRLFAIGLSTGVLALVINMMASIVTNMIPVAGVIIAVPILLGGHLFNIIMNTLGGFNHSMRLQFVEYFQKFYDGGGKMFRPFREELENVVITE
jgi:V/A-type H+-transporting ATPase subunit I